MSNWAENPENFRQSYMGFALPHVLFTECHKNCVDLEFNVAETHEQKTCIANCQDKTYAAFDLYMEINKRFAARKSTRDFIDIAKYTEMEIEHGHDTASATGNSFGHVHPR